MIALLGGAISATVGSFTKYWEELAIRYFPFITFLLQTSYKFVHSYMYICIYRLSE